MLFSRPFCALTYSTTKLSFSALSQLTTVSGDPESSPVFWYHLSSMASTNTAYGQTGERVSGAAKLKVGGAAKARASLPPL